MKICPNCHATLNDEAQFCVGCGTKVDTVAPQSNPANNTYFAAPNPTPAPAAAAPVYDPYDHTGEFDPKDISENKVLAMTPYLMGWIGVVICLLAINNSKYVAFHVKQALKITVCQILSVVLCIIPILGWIAYFVCLGILFVLNIIGFFNVCGGKVKEIPIIRGLKFLR